MLCAVWVPGFVKKKYMYIQVSWKKKKIIKNKKIIKCRFFFGPDSRPFFSRTNDDIARYLIRPRDDLDDWNMYTRWR